MLISNENKLNYQKLYITQDILLSWSEALKSYILKEKIISYWTKPTLQRRITKQKTGVAIQYTCRKSHSQRTRWKNRWHLKQGHIFSWTYFPIRSKVQCMNCLKDQSTFRSSSYSESSPNTSSTSPLPKEAVKDSTTSSAEGVSPSVCAS